ncbi:MAG: imelysin family protein [Bacteroidales bacterium]|jgi:predicted lipoprotein|nr:peptidase M75 [Bacteroidales bacterium]MDD2205025.1 imelysin family protein [Bacteroidales bacterium]MDD3152249.1 imelysin family protein [Bacteroidales bacterium]MDD3914503.1 imelysin family protein [Bacteroidales bacterium]MDD4634398.1 imelysin family protein [Bacteroidales bacterium]
MKFTFGKFAFIIVSAVILSTGLVSCNGENNGEETSDIDETKKAIITQFVNDVVVATYKNLADDAIVLSDACAALEASPTAANITIACDAWITARKYWEQSEAFLYGAASDYYIDPHIDSWPLDQAQLELFLQNEDIVASFDAGTLGYGLLGFHALEYVLFRDGTARNINEISPKELIYATLVANDLMSQCVRLEAAWAGLENVTSKKQQILAGAELEPSLDYGDLIENAGMSGNTKYKTQKSAFAEILQGTADIADEVGNTKITDPLTSQNVLDVESWYSWNSIADFADNIRSIQYAYYGGREKTTATEHSLCTYISSLDTDINTNIESAIATAIEKIEAMPAPFRNHLDDADGSAAAAVTACNNLLNALDAAIELIEEQQ